MFRFFNVYYSARILILIAGEAVMTWTSLLLGVMLRYREDSYLVLNFEFGYVKLLAVTLSALLLAHWFDLYNPANLDQNGDLYLRIVMVLGALSLLLAIVAMGFPRFLFGNHSLLTGLVILPFGLLAWRSAYVWLAHQPFLRERVYILGTGERAQRLFSSLRSRNELGIEVVGWTGEMSCPLTRENMGAHVREVAKRCSVHRVIVAMQDRRNSMPMPDLLQLRLERATQIEDATNLLERISGKIEVEQLNPSWIIFAKGFRFGSTYRVASRVLHFIVALIASLLCLPLIPFIILAIRLDSAGPVLYGQRRVGRGGRNFYCHKFRTMRPDAEADIGPTWADDDDPRITRVGKFLRLARLDEIPQLWCVLKGDMAFVGPRPERPEFVEWLTHEIPYYRVRHMVRPGITGWAQIRYKYGNTVEDAKEKLQYDLFYIKNASIGLDILIMFQTIKILILRRGAQ